MAFAQAGKDLALSEHRKGTFRAVRIEPRHFGDGLDQSVAGGLNGFHGRRGEWTAHAAPEPFKQFQALATRQVARCQGALDVSDPYDLASAALWQVSNQRILIHHPNHRPTRPSDRSSQRAFAFIPIRSAATRAIHLEPAVSFRGAETPR